jgi:biotin carboxyl carrier protein
LSFETEQDIHGTMDINLDALLERYHAHPFEDHCVETPHCGVVTLEVAENDEVKGPGGQWMHKPGSTLFVIEREKNRKKVTAPCDGHVADVDLSLDGSFVQAGERVLSIRHRLNRDEVIDRILKEVLVIFQAPQTARYMLVPDIYTRIEKDKGSGVALEEGDEFLIMSLMKRDSVLSYSGQPGMIYRVYFQQGELVEQGMPLVGLCPPENMTYIHRIIEKIRTDWES